MPKKLTGYVKQDENKQWFCRFDYTDETGKRRTIRRKAENKTKAKDLLSDLIRDYEQRGDAGIEGSRMDFAALADYYEKNYLIEPQYIDGRKVAGLRTFADFKLQLKVLKSYFGKHKLKSIRYADIERFKAVRLNTPTKSDTQRSITSVNRELALLRRVLNVAFRNDWISRNPFQGGKSLISLADEKQRDRTLSRSEEIQLLSACENECRKHIKPIIIVALDCGMRKGEILTLKWLDIDFTRGEWGIITIQAFNTKTMREREVAMTERVADELRLLYKASTGDPNGGVFGIKDNFYKSFHTACKLAGILDVHFHDLRHTCGTRLSASGMSLAEVGRILGHRQAQTTYRYVNASNETLKRAASALDEFNKAVNEVENSTIN